MHVGLKALPLNLHLQFRGFLHLGDMLTPFQYVHMLITITGRLTIVKKYSFTNCSFKLQLMKYNVVIFGPHVAVVNAIQ
jgi:hypothetical protein